MTRDSGQAVTGKLADGLGVLLWLVGVLSPFGVRGTKLPPETGAVAIFAGCIGKPLLLLTGSTVELLGDVDRPIAELAVLSPSVAFVLSSVITGGISAKGGEGGFGEGVVRLTLLPSPADMYS